jgi:hypothetical protein
LNHKNQIWKPAIIAAIVLQGTAAQQSIPCLAPPEAIDDLKFALAFEREFRTDPVRDALPKAAEPWSVSLQYTWWNIGLFFFLNTTGTAFSYNPDSVTRIVGSQISPITCNVGEDLIHCLGRMFPPPGAPSAARSYPRGGPTQAATILSRPTPPICSILISVPRWQPSPDSAFKRYIIQKIRERLPIELPGTPRRVLMSDFNLSDPTILIYAEVEEPKVGMHRLWLPTTLNRRRIPQPVFLTRLGESPVEDEDQVQILLKQSIQLFP